MPRQAAAVPCVIGFNIRIAFSFAAGIKGAHSYAEIEAMIRPRLNW